MTIAFVGDVHGCVLHLLVVLARWQLHHARRLDAVIQVGDLEAFRTPEAASRALVGATPTTIPPSSIGSASSIPTTASGVRQVVRPCALGAFDADAGFSCVTGEWRAETRGDVIDLDAVLPDGYE